MSYSDNGTDGATPPVIAGTGVRGWLRAIYERLLATLAVGGNVAHGAADSGNPLKVGGKITQGIPASIGTTGNRTDALFDEWGRLVVSDFDPELGSAQGTTSLRDRLTAQRHTVLADSIADGLASFWSQFQLNSAPAISVSGGEGLVQTGTGANGTSFMYSTAVRYRPGMVSWFNSAVRFRDPTLNVTNVQRVGVFSVDASGVPQDGYYYELSGTTFSVNTVKAGVVTSVPQASWSKNALAPAFTLGTSFVQCEIRFTANTAWFYVNNILRHSITGGAVPSTTTLNFRMCVESINSGGLTTNYTLGVRNIGLGRFGDPFEFPAPNGAPGVLPVGTGAYNGVAGTGSATVNVPAGAHVRSFSIVAGTSSATATIPGITGTVTIPGSSQNSQAFNENLDYNQMIGPVSFTISNAASYVVTWIVPS